MIYVFNSLVYLIEGLIVWSYIGKLFKKLYDEARTVLAWFVTYMILYVISFCGSLLLNGSCFLIINFILIYTFYECKIKSAIMHAFIIESLMALGEIIPIALHSEAILNFTKNGEIETATLIVAFFSKMILLVSLQIAANIQICKNDKEKQYRMSVLIVPILTALISYIFLFACLYNPTTKGIKIVIAICFIALLIIDLIVLWENENIQRNSIEKKELEVLLQRQRDEVAYYRLLDKQDQAQKILIHDIKKHLEYMEKLYQNGHPDEASKYANTIISDIEKTNISYSENKLLNIILNHYSEKCRNLDVQFSIDIRQGTIQNIRDDDLTALIGNLLENAVEAAAKSLAIEDRFIELSISKLEDTEKSLIAVVNSCSDSIEKDKLFTSSKGRMHGYGLKSIKKVVEKYGGEMKLYYDDESREFHAVIII